MLPGDKKKLTRRIFETRDQTYKKNAAPFLKNFLKTVSFLY